MRSDVFALPLCTLRALFSLTHTVMGEAVLTPADWTQSLMGISFHMVQLYLHGAALNLVLHMRTSTLIQLNTKSRSNSLIKLLEDREQPELNNLSCLQQQRTREQEALWGVLMRPGAVSVSLHISGVNLPFSQAKYSKKHAITASVKGHAQFPGLFTQSWRASLQPPPYPACNRMIWDSMIKVVSTV